MLSGDFNKVRKDKIIGIVGIKTPANLSKRGHSKLEADQSGFSKRREQE